MFFAPFLQLNYNGVNIPLPLNKDIVKWANETLRIMHTAKLPEGVKFYNLYGTSCETPFHAWSVRNLWGPFWWWCSVIALVILHLNSHCCTAGTLMSMLACFSYGSSKSPLDELTEILNLEVHRFCCVWIFTISSSINSRCLYIFSVSSVAFEIARMLDEQ